MDKVRKLLCLRWRAIMIWLGKKSRIDVGSDISIYEGLANSEVIKATVSLRG